MNTELGRNCRSDALSSVDVASRNGKQTCTKYVPADSAEKCQEAAVAAWLRRPLFS